MKEITEAQARKLPHGTMVTLKRDGVCDEMYRINGSCKFRAGRKRVFLEAAEYETAVVDTLAAVFENLDTVTKCDRGVLVWGLGLEHDESTVNPVGVPVKLDPRPWEVSYTIAVEGR